jgi:hypothetical protein
MESCFPSHVLTQTLFCWWIWVLSFKAVSHCLAFMLSFCWDAFLLSDCPNQTPQNLLVQRAPLPTAAASAVCPSRLLPPGSHYTVCSTIGPSSCALHTGRGMSFYPVFFAGLEVRDQVWLIITITSIITVPNICFRHCYMSGLLQSPFIGQLTRQVIRGVIIILLS